MSTFDPHCSFFIAAAWPMFVMALLVSKEIMPSVFMQKARYPIYTIFVVGFGNLIALFLWKYWLKRDIMEYGRFVVAAMFTAILGIAIFGPMHHYKDSAMWWRYVATVFITYQLVFPLIYLSEKWVCQGNYVKHIVV